MRKLILAAAVLLAGCSTDASNRFASGVSTLLDTVAAACAVYAPVAAPLMTLPDPRVQGLAVYGNAVCGPQGSVVAGFAPDAGTAAWIGAITGSLRALASSPVLVKPQAKYEIIDGGSAPARGVNRNGVAAAREEISGNAGAA